MSDPFERRLAACRERLAADALVLSPGPNLTYLTGFAESPSERHLFLIVPREGEPAFVAPRMYAAELAETPVADRRLYGDGEEPTALVESVLADSGLAGGPTRLLVEDRMWARFTEDLRSLPGIRIDGLASAIVEPLRIRKDEAELAALRRAGRVADRVASEIRERGEGVVGTTERDLAREVDRLLVEEGGLEPAFGTVVAAGENGARPHHGPGDREIRAGEPVVMDFGAFVGWDGPSGPQYPGDQTRTVAFGGEPTPDYRNVHEVVARAQEAAVERVEPGVAASDVDRAARDVIEEAGYGDAFVHRTGHGVGLEVHEPPYIAAGNDRRLEEGMVFSVEPGIYLEGEFGVRIEDLVVVTDEGCERLNDSPRGW
ncbi:Xaa-Pro peptidase family protein [Saliphagus sp. LR7]|uniref:M24 family metallopeptidase n=1 Tax=Saliphagus sp. LR7 TaxID=2282654 RepID=UPI000DF800F6|nr:Xaa-Pro peptidase family protein [Saliphagus sp. LR7]